MQNGSSPRVFIHRVLARISNGMEADDRCSNATNRRNMWKLEQVEKYTDALLAHKAPRLCTLPRLVHSIRFYSFSTTDVWKNVEYLGELPIQSDRYLSLSLSLSISLSLPLFLSLPFHRIRSTALAVYEQLIYR